MPPHAHGLCRHVGCHGRPLLLAGGKDVSLAPDDRLTAREHLSHLEGPLHGEGQRLGLSGERLLRPLGGLHRTHGHITYGTHTRMEEMGGWGHYNYGEVGTSKIETVASLRRLPRQPSALRGEKNPA